MSVPSTSARPLTAREREWLDFLLPEDRPGYAPVRQHVQGLVVLGEGRWGVGDLVLGRVGQEIDRTRGMEPVVAYGEIEGNSGDVSLRITLSLHERDDEDMVEFQTAALELSEIPEDLTERRRWSYSRWSPGDPCPATGAPVRQVWLNDAHDLLLAVSPAKRTLWIHDGIMMTNVLIPITNFYNELMLLKGVRDPRIALNHSLFFTEPDSCSDDELRAGFVRYNMSFRKVDPTRMRGAEQVDHAPDSLFGKVLKAFRGGR